MQTRVVLALWALVVLSPLARADYISQTFLLDQSSVLGGGNTYGSVRIEAYDGNGNGGGGLAAGQVRLTVQADVRPVYDTVGTHFGVYGLGFNTDLSLQPGQIAIPDNWRLRNGRFMGGFGQFGWEASGKIRDSQNPLVLTISDLGTDASLGHFLIASTNSTGGPPMNGSVNFAARIGGFEINNDLVDATTHVVGNGLPWVDGPPAPVPGGPPVDPVLLEGQGSSVPPAHENPEPGTLLLCALGAGGLGLGRWLKRRRGV
jgi:hypothetical protein